MAGPGTSGALSLVGGAPPCSPRLPCCRQGLDAAVKVPAMRRHGRFLVLCLMLMLLPLRSLLAAAQLDCGTPAAPSVMAHADHAHDSAHAHHDMEAQAESGQPACKLCAPCCLASAPPPAVVVVATAPDAVRASEAPAVRWVGVVPPLPDPPPRA